MKIPYKLLTAGALALALAGGTFAGAPSAEVASACVIPGKSATHTVIQATASPVTSVSEPVIFRTTERNYIGILPETTVQEAPAMRYLGRYKITGYDTCAKCCGKTDGVTASGTQATVGRTCAASKDLPFGTRLYIEGIGERIVEDRGGGVKGDHIDVLCEDHPACYAITGYYEVYIIEE